MNTAFSEGFIKQAATQGLSRVAATRLLKTAGFFDWFDPSYRANQFTNYQDDGAISSAHEIGWLQPVRAYARTVKPDFSSPMNYIKDLGSTLINPLGRYIPDVGKLQANYADIKNDEAKNLANAYAQKTLHRLQQGDENVATEAATSAKDWASKVPDMNYHKTFGEQLDSGVASMQDAIHRKMQQDHELQLSSQNLRDSSKQPLIQPFKPHNLAPGVGYQPPQPPTPPKPAAPAVKPFKSVNPMGINPATVL